MTDVLHLQKIPNSIADLLNEWMSKGGVKRNKIMFYRLAAVCSSLWLTRNKTTTEVVLVSHPTEVVYKIISLYCNGKVWTRRETN